MKLRTLLLTGGMSLALTVSAAAQTPFATAQVSRKPQETAAPKEGGAETTEAEKQRVRTEEQEARGGSAANAWLGAQLGYKFGNSDGLGENLLVSASVIHEIRLAERPFHLPVISNFADLVKLDGDENGEEEDEDKLKTLMLGSSGIRAGLFPYAELTGLRTRDFTLVLHGEASWKINAFKQEDSDELDYVNQLRLAGGFEVAIGVVGDDKRPLTFSLTPVLTKFDPNEYEKVFKERKSTLVTLEVVAVLPIAASTGVLFEYVGGDVNSFRAGVIVAAAR